MAVEISLFDIRKGDELLVLKGKRLKPGTKCTALSDAYVIRYDHVLTIVVDVKVGNQVFHTINTDNLNKINFFQNHERPCNFCKNRAVHIRYYEDDLHGVCQECRVNCLAPFPRRHVRHATRKQTYGYTGQTLGLPEELGLLDALYENPFDCTMWSIYADLHEEYGSECCHDIRSELKHYTTTQKNVRVETRSDGNYLVGFKPYRCCQEWVSELKITRHGWYSGLERHKPYCIRHDFPKKLINLTRSLTCQL